jgi:hypothetical protein
MKLQREADPVANAAYKQNEKDPNALARAKKAELYAVDPDTLFLPTVLSGINDREPLSKYDRLLSKIIDGDVISWRPIPLCTTNQKNMAAINSRQAFSSLQRSASIL